MQEMMDWKFDLTLHDDGGAGAGAAGGGEGGTGTDAGVTEGDAVPTNPNRRNRKTNPLANVRYGKQETTQDNTQTAPSQEVQADPDEEWKAVKEKYKDHFNADTTAIVQERLKNSKQAEATLGKLAPVFEGLGKKYGKEASDIDGIIAAYTDDDSLYEEEAAAAGMPVSAYKQLKALEADKAQREAQEMESHHMRHIQGLIDQGEKLKATFPNFDLRAEMQNPVFQRLTSPEVGIDVETAYWTIHRNELQTAAMQVAAQKTSQKLSQSIQSGITRPAENGSRNVSPALDIRDDPSKWSKNDREEVKRRVRNGERIIL
jgi:hypothetical protein